MRFNAVNRSFFGVYSLIQKIVGQFGATLVLKMFPILICLTLVSCGQPIADDVAAINNHGYGFRFDAESPVFGIRIRYFAEPHVVPGYFDDVYAKTRSCVERSLSLDAGEPVSIEVPSPLIVFVPDIPDLPNGDARHGITYVDTGLILLEQGLVDSISVDNNTSALDFTDSHEFVHWFLRDRLTIEQQQNHDAPEFQRCSISLSMQPF